MTIELAEDNKLQKISQVNIFLLSDWCKQTSNHNWLASVSRIIIALQSKVRFLLDIGGSELGNYN